MAETPTTKIKFNLDKDELAALGKTIVLNAGAGPEEYAVERGSITVPSHRAADVLGAFPGSTVEDGTPVPDQN